MMMNRTQFEAGLDRLPYRVTTLNRSGIGVAVSALSEGGDELFDVFGATLKVNWKKVVKTIFVLTNEVLARLETLANDLGLKEIANTLDAVQRALCLVLQWLTGETCT